MFLQYILLALINSLLINNTVYDLSSESEDYNTRYFYCNSSCNTIKGNILYLDAALPPAFVVEVGAIKDGEVFTIYYNGLKSLNIKKEKGKYKIGRKKIYFKFNDERKLSFYFVNNRLIVYVDDTQIYDRFFLFDRDKKIGFGWTNKLTDNNKFIFCYEPVPFVVSDYGKVLEGDSNLNGSTVRIVTENVGRDYSITRNASIVCNSAYSTRFEYRFQNSKEENKTTTQRARSEISGVYATTPLNKWIIDFDIYITNATQDDNDNFEIITQIHEGSTKPTTPSFYLALSGGFLKCCLRGDSKLIEEWDSNDSPIFRNSQKLKYIEKDKWHHVKVFLKEAYLEGLHPLTKIWVDGKLVLESSVPNSYHYTPRILDHYGYFKFGIYKPGWMAQDECDSLLSKRVYYFDNVVVKH